MNNLPKNFKKIQCPRCEKRIFDVAGRPNKKFWIKLKCRNCGYVFLSGKYIQKTLDNHNKVSKIKTNN
jgi:ribosomal protein L37AE/L43A